MSETVISTARVRLDRPARYGKLLASHFEQLIDATWDPETAKGTFTFPAVGQVDAPERGSATCDVIGTEGVLMLSVEGEELAVENVERELATRLIHLASDQDVVVEFSRGNRGRARFTREDTQEELTTA